MAAENDCTMQTCIRVALLLVVVVQVHRYTYSFTLYIGTHVFTVVQSRGTARTHIVL